jgi:outer membrane lipoprotein-sorting protein
MNNIWIRFLLSVGVIGILSTDAIAGVENANPPLSAKEIVEKADAIRNPAAAYFIKVEVKSTEDPSDIHVFNVAIQGNEKTRIETVQPKRDRGRTLLMLGENMWVYIPNLKREVRVSLNQKLTGQAANGDISRMRWSGDYTAQKESESEADWQLLLTAAKKGLTYDKIRVWVQKNNFHPTHAEYLTSQGKVLKKATYQNYKQMAGDLRPTEIVIQDAVKLSDQSIITIKDMQVKAFPGSVFNKNELDSQHLK